MRRLFHVDAETRAALVRSLEQELEADPAVAFAYLHGSFSGDIGFHDIDVGAYFSALPSESATHALDLAEKLSARTGFPVDVRALDNAPLAFLFHVLQGRLLVCHDEAVLADIIERTVPGYLDIEPLLRRATAEAFQR